MLSSCIFILTCDKQISLALIVYDRINLTLIIFPDGDLITIFESNDLSFAIQCSRILKLQILLNSDLKNDAASALSLTEVTSLKKQLRSIRDQVNKLLDSMDRTDNKRGGSSHAGKSSIIIVNVFNIELICNVIV